MMFVPRRFALLGALALMVALAVALAACDGDGDANGDTTAPGVTVAPDDGAPTEPEPMPTEPEEAPAEPEPVPTEPEEGEDETFRVDIFASEIMYSESSLAAPANEPFVVVFENRDAGIPHTFTIFEDTDAVLEGEPPLASTPQFVGPDTQTLSVDPLPAGRYFFQCQVHLIMNGTLTVGEPR